MPAWSTAVRAAVCSGSRSEPSPSESPLTRTIQRGARSPGGDVAARAPNVDESALGDVDGSWLVLATDELLVYEPQPPAHAEILGRGECERLQPDDRICAFLAVEGSVENARRLFAPFV